MEETGELAAKKKELNDRMEVLVGDSQEELMRRLLGMRELRFDRSAIERAIISYFAVIQDETLAQQWDAQDALEALGAQEAARWGAKRARLEALGVRQRKVARRVRAAAGPSKSQFGATSATGSTATDLQNATSGAGCASSSLSTDSDNLSHPLGSPPVLHQNSTGVQLLSGTLSTTGQTQNGSTSVGALGLNAESNVQGPERRATQGARAMPSASAGLASGFLASFLSHRMNTSTNATSVSTVGPAEQMGTSTGGSSNTMIGGQQAVTHLQMERNMGRSSWRLPALGPDGSVGPDVPDGSLGPVGPVDGQMESEQSPSAGEELLRSAQRLYATTHTDDGGRMRECTACGNRFSATGSPNRMLLHVLSAHLHEDLLRLLLDAAQSVCSFSFFTPSFALL